MANLSEFKAKFTKSITLRNELVPIGKTLENIQKKSIVEDDELLSENYKKAKKIIDDFHRSFIDKVLSGCSYDWKALADLMQSAAKIKDEEKEAYEEKLMEQQANARESIVDLFRSYIFGTKTKKTKKEDDLDSKTDEKLVFEDVFKEALIKELIPPTLENDEDRNIIKGFSEFTTYFRGFNENRKNMYSSEEKSTAISYRIVNENFPKFLSNSGIFDVWQKECPECISKAESELKAANLLKDDENLSELFSISSFNKFITQSGIDLYNKLLGGLPAEPGQVKVTGLNEQINLACQKDKALFETLKKKRGLKMVVLFKQILSDRIGSFVIEEFENDTDAVSSVASFYKSVLEDGGCVKTLFSLLEKIKEYDCSKILVQGKNINALSKDLYGGDHWSLIKDAICREKSDEKNLKRLIKVNSSPEAIDSFIAKYDYSVDFLSKVTGKDIAADIVSCLQEKQKILIKVNSAEWPKQLKGAEEKEAIKQPLDALLSLYKFMSIFETKSFDKDLNFYADFDPAINDFAPVMSLYNKVRNYATKKPYSIEKFKLNFNNSQLAGGWSETKEKDCCSVIFKKDQKFYLGIFMKPNKPDFKSYISESGVADSYQKMEYVLFKGFQKMLPKCVFTKAVKSHFNESDLDFTLYDDKTFAKPLIIKKELFLLNCDKSAKVKKFQKAYQKIDGNEYKRALTVWIDFAKEFLSSYKTTSKFDFSLLKKSEEYEDVSDFYNQVDSIAYKIDWVNIDKKYIDNLVDEGKLFLFQIYNKDFASGCHGSKNLHTLYLESIFDPRNAQLGIVKLNGEAELFYRHRSIDDKNKVVHADKSKLVNRVYFDPDTGRSVQLPEEYYLEIYKYVNGKISESELSDDARKYLKYAVVKDASHEIIKDRRFTQDKFFFHCPISINYKAGAPKKFNDKVLEFLRNNKDINIIGLDRGERNLVYATVINQNGDILECKSFNCVTHKSSDKSYEVDFHAKLELKEKERDNARRSWNTVSKIATLKEGYLSTVIHELANLMIKYNAIIVLENLNMGFKRVRGGIAERSVYQKFEKMLIDKLNYLVFKSNDWTQAGGVLNGYQLTNQLSSFKEISAQTGFLFYVPAAYTSKIDPATGFINAISFGRIKNSDEKKELLESFDSICYVREEDLFKFSIDYSKLKVTDDLPIKKWDVYSIGNRIVRKKNVAGKLIEMKNYSPTEELKTLFTNAGIKYDTGENLQNQLLNNGSIDAKFWNTLFDIFKNILQMRNSAAGTMEDYLQSPVKDSRGRFFNSSNAAGTQYEKLTDADANGAYHIALKGLLLLMKNNAVKSDKDLKNVRTMTSKEWFQFVQKDIRK